MDKPLITADCLISKLNNQPLISSTSFHGFAGKLNGCCQVFFLLHRKLLINFSFREALQGMESTVIAKVQILEPECLVLSTQKGS